VLSFLVRGRDLPSERAGGVGVRRQPGFVLRSGCLLPGLAGLAVGYWL
jgi:hypothetical protein